MPTLQTMELPKPQTWQEFESLVRDAQAQRWASPNLAKNGRSGQKQAGVDIYGPDEIGRPVGIQCKRFAKKLSLKVVEKEIANAESFKGRLTTLFIATTAEHDAKLQEQVRTLSETRVAAGKFAVALLYWDEIAAGLVMNGTVLKAHYPNLSIPNVEEVDKARQIAALELGYYGADLRAYLELTFGEAGFLAQQDPHEFYAALSLLARRARQLLPPEEAEPIVKALEKVRKGCKAQLKSKKATQAGWAVPMAQAERASARIKAASSHLGMADSNMVELGLQLGRIYHHSDDTPDAELQGSVRMKVEAVLPEGSAEAISQRFQNAATKTSGFAWAKRIYSLLDSETRFRR